MPIAAPQCISRTNFENSLTKGRVGVRTRWVVRRPTVVEGGQRVDCAHLRIEASGGVGEQAAGTRRRRERWRVPRRSTVRWQKFYSRVCRAHAGPPAGCGTPQFLKSAGKIVASANGSSAHDQDRLTTRAATKHGIRRRLSFAISPFLLVHLLRKS